MPETEADLLPRTNVLGVQVLAIDLDTAVARCEQLLAGDGKGYVCVTGVHGVMESRSDAELRTVLNRAFLCLPDGMPTVWVGRLQGHRGIRRVYGPDFMMAMCRRSQQTGWRHFLYGGAPGVVDKLAERLVSLMPWLCIAGTYTPPYAPLTPTQERELTDKVAHARPDILWVGVSTPKQEKFMAQYCDKLQVPLMVGVGAAFDLHAGLRRDAPDWMKRSGLQWLHRLCQEPRRLAPRYLRHNPRFLWEIGLQLSGWGPAGTD